jgi:outer membrane lipoprotein SlyB
MTVADAGAPPPMSAPAAPVCSSCGTVRSVQQVETKGEGSGLGAVAGGVLGAVVGHQVGQGGGNTLATIIGAGGGALAGNAVEKNVKKTISWKVTVEMNDGAIRTFSFPSAPAYAAGDRVRVSNGQLVSN